jgi:23S rRNA (uracil1939-C5)-methyltransferase
VIWRIHREHGKTRLAYQREESHESIPFDDCWIIPEALNQLTQWLSEHLPIETSIERIQARINTNGRIFLTFFQTRDEVFSSDLIPSLTEVFPVVGAQWLHEQTVLTQWGEQKLSETLCGYTFNLSPESFFQVNHAMAERMIMLLQEWLIPDCERLLDCYAGVGTFAIALHQQAKEIVAIESSPSAVEDAQGNIEANRCANIRFLSGLAQQVLPKLEESFDAAILDPPRAGCHPQVLRWVSQHVKSQLIYVSCDPATLARDLKTLVADGGWAIEAVQPLDMFPQTHHVETMVRLRKNEIEEKSLS